MHLVLKITFYIVLLISTLEVFSLSKMSSLAQKSSRCSVTYANRTEVEKRYDSCQDRPDQYYYDYQRKYHKSPPCQYNRTVRKYYRLYDIERIANSTIMCTNILSTKDITYKYTDEDYEQFLIITHSNVSTLPSLSFVTFKTITKLYLGQIHVRTIKPGAFNGLSSLRELYLENNELLEVPNGIFNTLHLLEVLNLTNNKIAHIKRDAFLGMASITTLLLKNNDLFMIEKGVFETQQNLTYLDLSNNPLKVLSLNGLTSLDTLLAAGSNLSSFEEDLSNSTMKLLDLSSGNLSQIDFSYFPRVKNLNLSGNMITAIDKCEILNSVIVNLASNEISTINGTFSGILEIYLGHNELKILDNTLLNKSRNLLIADFSFNKISSVDKNVFQGLISLKKLFLQNNEIVKISPLLFRDLTNLTFLNLSHNSIEEFQLGTFDSLTMLEILDISHNKLVDLHQHIFHSLSKLRDLHLDNNQISSFDWENFLILRSPQISSSYSEKLHLRHPALLYVSLNRNPWKCEELVKMSQLLQRFGVSVSDGHEYGVENVLGIPCLREKNVLKPINVSGFSAEKFSASFQKAIDDGVKNSTMNYFFNDDFRKSKFFQYFNNDYARSNFFKLLNNFKLVSVQQNVNDSKVEKFTSLQIKPNESNVTPILIVVVILLFALLFLISVIVYLLTSLLKKRESCLLTHLELN